MPLNFGGQKRSGAFDMVWPPAIVEEPAKKTDPKQTNRQTWACNCSQDEKQHTQQPRQTDRDMKKKYVPRLTPYRVEAEAKRQRPAGLCLLPLPLPFYSVNRKITVDGRWGDRGKAGREVGWCLQVWWWGWWCCHHSPTCIWLVHGSSSSFLIVAS